LVVAAGVNVFDTADSYGTGALNGRSEQLLGRFIRWVRFRGGRQQPKVAGLSLQYSF